MADRKKDAQNDLPSSNPPDPARQAPSHLFHLRALKIGADGQRTRIILLHVRHCRIEIEIPDMTQYELLRIRALRHSSHYGGESLDGIGRAYPDRQMHDQDVRTLREIREAQIGAGLVRAVNNFSELELSILRQRSQEALRLKATRGDLHTSVAIGYVRSADDRLEMDPDKRVREALHLAFRKFTEFGSVRQVSMWLCDEGLKMPIVVYGPRGRMVEWRLPRYNTIHRLLTNPIYARALTYLVEPDRR